MHTLLINDLKIKITNTNKHIARLGKPLKLFLLSNTKAHTQTNMHTHEHTPKHTYPNTNTHSQIQTHLNTHTRKTYKQKHSCTLLSIFCTKVLSWPRAILS